MASVGMQVVRKHAAIGGRPRPLLRAQHHRPRPVAEQHAGRPVLPVEDPGKGLRTDHQGGSRLAEANEIVGDVERIDEARANRLDVECRAPLHAERVLHAGRGGGEGLVGRRGGDNDEVEIGRLHARLVEGGSGGGGRQMGCELAGIGDASFADAGALDDPLVRRVDHPRQFLVGQHLFGKIPTAAGDDGPRHHQDAAARVRACIDSDPPSSCAVIFSLKRCAAMSTATPIALAKPKASVEPWLLTTVPLSPRNMAPL